MHTLFGKWSDIETFRQCGRRAHDKWEPLCLSLSVWSKKSWQAPRVGLYPLNTEHPPCAAGLCLGVNMLTWLRGLKLIWLFCCTEIVYLFFFYIPGSYCWDDLASFVIGLLFDCYKIMEYYDIFFPTLNVICEHFLGSCVFFSLILNVCFLLRYIMLIHKNSMPLAPSCEGGIITKIIITI